MNKKMIIMIVVGMLVGAGGSAGFFMTRTPPPVVEGEQPPPSNKPPGIVKLETFLVNINDENGDRFAKLNVQLTVTPASVASDIQGNDLLQAKMRDRVLTLLTGKTLEDLLGPIGKEGLRHEIKAQLSPVLDEGQIEEVLFSDFVIQ